MLSEINVLPYTMTLRVLEPTLETVMPIEQVLEPTLETVMPIEQPSIYMPHLSLRCYSRI